MARIIFIYGAIAGLVVITTMTLGIHFAGDQGGSSQIVGYLIMLVALTLIFIGVKRHRDQSLGGIIKFLPAFLTGLAIAAVAGIFYVAGWESYLALSDYSFAEQYAAGVLEKKKAAGVTGAELERLTAEMAKMVEGYANPLIRIPITFLEIFPIGFVVSLVSAAILRNPKAFPKREI